MKILVAGDVEGQWTALNARVAKLQSSKHGPFDALLLCGRVYPRDDAPLAAEDEAFLSGERALPLPCHFVVVGEHPAARALLERMPSGGELSATLRFLGAGVGVADIDGLKVAFASGGGGDDGSASVDGALGADVLLTAEWPQGVCRPCGVWPYGVCCPCPACPQSPCGVCGSDGCGPGKAGLAEMS